MLKLTSPVHHSALTYEVEQPVWIEEWSGFNKMPVPYEEIEEDEFYHRWMYVIKYTDFRQVALEEGEAVRSVYIFWFHNEALAIAHPGKWAMVEGKFTYTEPVKYFRIGCQHHNVEQAGSRMHLHKYQCSKCGYQQTIDSSG